MRGRGVLLAAAVLIILPSAVWADADIDNDGDFDPVDIATFVNAWVIRHSLGPGWDPRADLNEDGALDWHDARIFTEALLSPTVPQAVLTDYFIPDTNRRYFWREATEQESILVANGAITQTDPADADRLGEYREMVTDPCKFRLWSIGWSQTDDGHIVVKSLALPVFNIFAEETVFAQPNGVELPRELRAGQTFSTQVETDNGDQVTFSFTVQETMVRVVTRAGEFDDCIDVEIELSSIVGSLSIRLWLQRGLGPVKWVGGAAGQVRTFTLEWALVNGQFIGQLRTLNVSHSIPCQPGQRWIFENEKAEKWGAWAFNPVSVQGMTCTPIVKMTAKYLTADRDYWLVDNGYFCGFAGTYTNGSNFLFKPSGLCIPTDREMIVGWPLDQSGNLQKDDDPNFDEWEARIELIALHQDVGPWSDCFVLAVRLDAPVSPDVFPPDDAAYIWVKPGVGMVHFEEPLARLNPNPPFEQLVYTKVGSQEYGQLPRIDFVDALHLYPGDRRLFNYYGVESTLMSSALGQEMLEMQEIFETEEAVGWQTVKKLKLLRSYWDITSEFGNFAGILIDPLGSGFTVPLKFETPMQIPRSMAMGDAVVHQTALFRADNNQYCGRVDIVLVYVTDDDFSSECDYPTANNAHVIEWLWTVRDQTGTITQYFLRQTLVPDLGKVQEWAEVTRGDHKYDWLVKAWSIKTSDGTWSWPTTRYSPRTYMPYDPGNEWIFGLGNNDYLRLFVQDVWDSPDMGQVLPLVREPYPGGGAQEIQFYRSPLSPVCLAGYKPSWSMVPGRLDTPFTLPNYVESAQVTRTVCDTLFTLGGNTTRIPTEVTFVPLYLTSQNTAAGHFDDVLLTYWIMHCDYTPAGHDPEWIISRVGYAPTVGPVVIREQRSSGDAFYSGIVYAKVGFREWGTKP